MEKGKGPDLISIIDGFLSKTRKGQIIYVRSQFGS